MEPSITEIEPLAEKDGIDGFAKRVLRYFQDFIQTDFKRQQAPRRRVIPKNDAGFRAISGSDSATLIDNSRPQ